MQQNFYLYLNTFIHWLENFEKVSFDIEEEDKEDVRTLLIKLTENKFIDQGEIELLYTLCLDNEHFGKDEGIKLQAHELLIFLKKNVLQNIIRE